MRVGLAFASFLPIMGMPPTSSSYLAYLYYYKLQKHSLSSRFRPARECVAVVWQGLHKKDSRHITIYSSHTPPCLEKPRSPKKHGLLSPLWGRGNARVQRRRAGR
ncbi:hypothetical protein GGR51DRAFT_293174 [Nemania sp. FL0031]|nr:hypothetical protein GGR51DRAFT_293174 [Nemania sp. FL0031]